MEIQKRKKTYYQNSGSHYKKHKQLYLESGMTGFLCTCNFRQKDCVRDAYKLLNEFADELYGPSGRKDPDSNVKIPEAEKADSVNETEQNDSDEDISSALNKEIGELKAEYSKPVAARRFQVVETGVQNVLFIRTTLPDPVELVTKIITELDRTKQQRTRFLLRLLPIEVVCKAYMNDIKLKANAMLEKYFVQEPKTFSIVFSRHSNNNIVRADVIEDLAEIIIEKNPGNKADLKNPELAVIVEVIRGVCLMTVAPNYYKFKKYNLLEICNVKEPAKDKKETNPEESKDLEEDKKESEEAENLSEEKTDNDNEPNN